MGAPEPAAPLSPAPGAFSYEHEGDRQFATTLARGLEVLRCFTPLEPLLGKLDIATMREANLRAGGSQGAASPDTVARWLWEKIGGK